MSQANMGEVKEGLPAEQAVSTELEPIELEPTRSRGMTRSRLNTARGFLRRPSWPSSPLWSSSVMPVDINECDRLRARAGSHGLPLNYCSTNNNEDNTSNKAMGQIHLTSNAVVTRGTKKSLAQSNVCDVII